MENLTNVIQSNLAYLRLVEHKDQQDLAIQKLRNTCLCIEIALKKEVVGEAVTRTVPSLIESLTRKEAKYLKRLVADDERPTLQQSGINRYVRYLLSFLPSAEQ